MADIISTTPFDCAQNVSRRYKDMGDGTYAEIVSSVPSSTTNAAAGISAKGTVDTSGTNVIVAAAAYTRQVIIQNTDASKTLYVSFTSPAVSTDIVLISGASLNLNYGPTNAIYAKGDSAGCAYAVVGA